MKSIDWSFWAPVTLIVIFAIFSFTLLVSDNTSMRDAAEVKKRQFMQCVALNGTLVEGRHMNLCVTGIIPMEDQ